MDLTRFFLNRLCNSFIPKTIGKAMGTHKNKKKKKKVEEIIGNKRSRVGTNRK